MAFKDRSDSNSIEEDIEAIAKSCFVRKLFDLVSSENDEGECHTPEISVVFRPQELNPVILFPTPFLKYIL
jgi:hypothetical protein